MAFTIFTEMAQPGPDMFYDPKFRLMVETHINILRTVNSTVEQIPDNHYYQHEGDFNGYLVSRGVPAWLHWVYMRVNHMENSNQFAKDLRDPLNKRIEPRVIIPHDAVLADIQQMYISLKK